MTEWLYTTRVAVAILAAQDGREVQVSIGRGSAKCWEEAAPVQIFEGREMRVAPEEPPEDKAVSVDCFKTKELLEVLSLQERSGGFMALDEKGEPGQRLWRIPEEVIPFVVGKMLDPEIRARILREAACGMGVESKPEVVPVEIKPGPELDQAVAEAAGLYERQDASDPVNPSTDLRAAFAMAGRVGLFKQYGYCEAIGQHVISKTVPVKCWGDTIAHEETPALAICAAILGLKGSDGQAN